MTPEEVAARFAERFGDAAGFDPSYATPTVDVPATSWREAMTFARDDLGCTFFDWLSAVDELDGFSVCAHVARVDPPDRHRLVLRTRVAHDEPRLPTVVDLFAGASWHERETFEMFGIVFAGHPNLVPLLLPEGFEGHPLRKDFVLAARAAKPWPGAKEPGESEHGPGGGAPSRRRMQPPGVPDPDSWGPRPPAPPDEEAAP